MTRINRKAAIAALFFLGMPLAAVGTPAASAATDVQALVRQAIRDTNTVNTIVHHDQSTIVQGTSSLKETASGVEDEVQNREQDSETVTITAPGPTGKVQTVHYTIDVIFIKGYTYYRTTLQKTGWQRRKGTSLTDPYTRGTFRRARTKVAPPPGFTLGSYHLVGTSGGQTHVQAPLAAKTAAGTFDLWISSGAKPYVVRQEDTVHSTGGRKTTESDRTDYGPFNQPVTIQPPITTGST